MDIPIYNLPHSTLRPHQSETIEWLLNQSSTSILSAPTGSGKSAYVKAVSSQRKTFVLTRTKSLQYANYDRTYGMDTLYGKSNYECCHPDNSGNSANLCLYADLGMHKCSHASDCSYLIAKGKVVNSNQVSLNYSYWLTAQRGWLKEGMPEVLFLDECHLLPSLVRDWAGCTVDEQERQRWNLPDFPILNQGRTSSNSGLQLFSPVSSQQIKSNPVDEAICWLEECLVILRKKIIELGNEVKRDRTDDKKLKGLFHACESLGMKLRGCLESLEANPTDWYIKSGFNVFERKFKGRADLVSGFLCKPLTAKYHFPRLFLKPNVNHTVLMSATIGKPEQFVKELGITQYNLRLVPNVFKPEDRPVYVFKSCPKMGYEQDRNKLLAKSTQQAKLIADLILSYPPHWTGVIHVNSKDKANRLMVNLNNQGLNKRACITPEVGTEKQLEWWNNHKKRIRGAICVAWSFAEGVDLFDDNFCISADIPFGDQGSEYGKALFNYNIPFYMWEAAMNLEQRSGRIRRGDVSHYGVEAEKIVAVFDGNWSRIKSYLSEDFMKSIVEV